MKQLTKQQAKTFGDWGYLAVVKHFNKILKHEAGVLKDTDPEELHQMRVGMRRLRSAIAGFAPALNLPKAAAEKKVGKIARILGMLRDLDVLLESLQNKYQPALPKAEKKELSKVLKVLQEKRKDTFNKVERILKDEDYHKLKEAFETWLDKPNYSPTAAISINYVLPDLLLPETCRLLIHTGWLIGVKVEDGVINIPQDLSKEEVEKILAEDGQNLHDLRKEAKRSRYQMELFTQFYGESYQNYLNDIKQIQEILGNIQDCFVLAEFLSEVFESDLDENLPTLSDKLRETRYEKWQEWQQFQCKFFDLNTRQDLLLTIQQPNEEKEAQEQLV